MRCPHCGFENVPEKTMICPSCNEPVDTGKTPPVQIKSSLVVGNQSGGTVIGTEIHDVGKAVIGNAQIDHAQVALSPDTEQLMVEKVIEGIVSRWGVSLEKLQAGNAKVVPKAKKEIDTVLETVGIKKLPVSPNSLYRLGMLAAYNKDSDNAVAYFRKTIQADPGHSEAYRAIAWLQQMRALTEIENGNLPKASDMLREAQDAALHVKDIDSLVQQGYNFKTLAQVAESRDGKMSAEASAYYSGAETIFSDILKEDPDNEGAINGLGNVRFARGEVDAAIDHATRAAAISPFYTAAYFDLSIYLEKKMGLDAGHAAEWCRKAKDALTKAYSCSKMDPGFSNQDRDEILARISRLDAFCGKKRRAG